MCILRLEYWHNQGPLFYIHFLKYLLCFLILVPRLSSSLRRLEYYLVDIVFAFQLPIPVYEFVELFYQFFPLLLNRVLRRLPSYVGAYGRC